MPKGDYKRLEERLVLVAWLNSLFGYEHNRDLLKDLADHAFRVASPRFHACAGLPSDTNHAQGVVTGGFGQTLGIVFRQQGLGGG
jgi:hypothetical protein